MQTNSDFRDLLAALNGAAAEYLVVWVRPTPQNAERVYRALAAFGAPLHELKVEDLSAAGTVFQIGVEPVGVDIITAIDGVDFESAWLDRVRADYDDQPVSVISREHLIQNKKAAGRPQDLADVDALERLDET